MLRNISKGVLDALGDTVKSVVAIFSDSKLEPNFLIFLRLYGISAFMFLSLLSLVALSISFRGDSVFLEVGNK